MLEIFVKFSPRIKGKQKENRMSSRQRCQILFKKKQDGETG